jgi:hypothetical protein
VLVFFWAKKSPKGKIFFFKGIFCHKYFFLKTFEIFFQESITTIIIIINYDFEETFENMSPEQFKFFLGFLSP